MKDTMLQHGEDFAGQSVKGWFMSEKLRGCRVFWDGSTLWSRGGLALELPSDWQMPAFPIDCELYAGIGSERRCAVAIKRRRIESDMRLHAFDAPEAQGTWPQRMASIPATNAVSPVSWRVCTGIGDAMAEMMRVVSEGGEGVMLRHPSLTYSAGRTDRLLKLKQ